MKYIVLVREVHIQPVAVEADNKADAIWRVEKGEGAYCYDRIAYSYTLDSKNWTVEEVPAAPDAQLHNLQAKTRPTE
jgi:hypothetical protein